MNKKTKEKKTVIKTEIKEEKKTEPNKQINFLKIGVYISIVLIIATIAGTGIAIMIKAQSLNPDQTMISFIYILGAGWMVALPLIAIMFIARREIFNKLKIFGRKSKVLIFRMIGGDGNELDVILKLKGNTIDVGENKVIVNFRKTTMKDGVRVITYVADNALAHDYFQDQNETLKKIGQRLAAKKAEDFHDIYSDPIRVDAKYFNETFLAAQQTNPDILKKIIAFLTSRNVIGMLLVIAIAAGAAALLSMQANNILNTIPFCNPTSITP
ncbi:hypothetical protein LCGC14_1118760 [marine sediment metagenome]|uniref:Uncharacterized protein n=1 Tax=marine sediment metagenome TaxID=412755 RepID=A0A0F9PMR7_9ZZZZ